MPAVRRQTSLMHEIAHAIHAMGQMLKNLLPAEPAPYWTDYLRAEREKNN
ncbi:hypothetical protein [Phaeovulum sp.]